MMSFLTNKNDVGLILIINFYLTHSRTLPSHGLRNETYTYQTAPQWFYIGTNSNLELRLHRLVRKFSFVQQIINNQTMHESLEKMDICMYVGLKKAKKYLQKFVVVNLLRLLGFVSLLVVDQFDGGKLLALTILGILGCAILLLVSLGQIRKTFGDNPANNLKILREARKMYHSTSKEIIPMDEPLDHLVNSVSTRLYYAPASLLISDPRLTLSIKKRCECMMKWRVLTALYPFCLSYFIKLFIAMFTGVLWISKGKTVSIVLKSICSIFVLIDICKMIWEIYQICKANKPESAEELFNLGPKIVITAADMRIDLMELHAKKEDFGQCPICLSELNQMEPIVHLPCFQRHILHKSCINEWIKKSKTCPICRHALPASFRAI